MTSTQNFNLLLSFTLAGDRHCRVRGAARIKVDGRGALTVFDAESGAGEQMAIADLQSLSIDFLGCAGKAA